VSALMIVVISEVAKRTGVVGGLIASLPTVSILSMVWLYHDTQNVERIAALASSIVWFVLPSLVLFVMLPVLLKKGMAFYPALLLSSGITMAGYAATFAMLRRFGVEI
jgi:F0F1-type ATP synthase assembly protein I